MCQFNGSTACFQSGFSYMQDVSSAEELEQSSSVTVDVEIMSGYLFYFCATAVVHWCD